MTYAPGLPLLMPMACVTSFMFFLSDKILLLRYYQKPPHISEHAMKIVLSILPYAVLTRLAVAIWMFGNTNIFSSHNNDFFGIIPFRLKFPNLPEYLEVSSENFNFFLNRFKNIAGSRYFFLEKKVFQPQTFPLFVLFILILAVKFLLKYFKFFSLHKVFLAVFTSILDVLSCCYKRKKTVYVDSGGKLLPYYIMKLNDDLRQEVRYK